MFAREKGQGLFGLNKKKKMKKQNLATLKMKIADR